MSFSYNLIKLIIEQNSKDREIMILNKMIFN